MKKIIASLSCFCLVAIFGIVSWQAGLFKAKPEQVVSDALYPGIKDNFGPGEEETVSSGMLDIDPDTVTVGDIYGMIIYNGVTYSQNPSITEKDGLVPDEKLGNGEDFDGTYNPEWCEKKFFMATNPDGFVKAEVYSVKDREDILCVKLCNGATVYLDKKITVNY